MMPASRTSRIGRMTCAEKSSEDAVSELKQSKSLLQIGPQRRGFGRAAKMKLRQAKIYLTSALEEVEWSLSEWPDKEQLTEDEERMVRQKLLLKGDDQADIGSGAT